MPRNRCPHTFYHVMARGDDRMALASRQRERSAFAECLGNLSYTHDIAIHAWCLMDNHYHLVVKKGDISKGKTKKGDRFIFGSSAESVGS